MKWKSNQDITPTFPKNLEKYTLVLILNLIEIVKKILRKVQQNYAKNVLVCLFDYTFGLSCTKILNHRVKVAFISCNS